MTRAITSCSGGRNGARARNQSQEWWNQAAAPPWLLSWASKEATAGPPSLISVMPMKTRGTTISRSTSTVSSAAVRVRPRRGPTHRRTGPRLIASTTAQPISARKGCTIRQASQPISRTVP